MSATFEAIVAVGKLAVDGIKDAVDRVNIKKMVVTLEAKIHDQYNLIKGLISKVKTLEERLKARDRRVEELKAQNFELMRYEEANIKKES